MSKTLTEKSELKLGIVVNPTSGRGSGRAWLTSVQKKLGDRADLIVAETYAAGSARHQARELAVAGCNIVAAAGGDGTLHDVLEGILGTDSALAVIPLGTGNDFARSIGFETNVDAAMSAIFAGNLERIDVARWSRGEQSGHFVNVAGCGFDAVVASRVNRGFRKLRGRWVYIGAVLTTLASYHAEPVSIEVDGELIECRVMLCAFANAKSYGGGMLMAPLAELSDGLLDLVVVEELSKIALIKAFPRVFKGTHLSHPKVRHRQFKSLTIRSDSPMPYLLDGEVLAPGPLRIDVVPSAIEVVMPRRGSESASADRRS